MKRLENTPSLLGIMRSLNAKHQFGLRPETFAMVGDFEHEMRSRSVDPPHDIVHLIHMAKDTGIAYRSVPGFAARLDHDTFWRALASHDMSAAEREPGKLSLLLNQGFEDFFADRPVRRYMEQHQYPYHEIERVAAVVRFHPLDVLHPKRLKWEREVDDQLAFTARALTLIDSLEVFRITRIDKMLLLIQQSLKRPVVPLYPILQKYFQNHTKFNFHLPGTNWFHEEAARRREKALMYVEDLAKTRRDVTKGE